MTECPVCCDEAPEVECNYCQYAVCKSCVSQYLLGTPDTAHCMQCKKPWTREYMIQSISSKFVLNDYKQHRENVLMDLEKAKLPEAQLQAEREMRKKEKMKAVDQLKLEMNQAVEVFMKDHSDYALLQRKLLDFYKKTQLIYHIDSVLAKFERNRDRWQTVCCATGIVNDDLRCTNCDRSYCDKCMCVKYVVNHQCVPINVQYRNAIKQHMSEYKKLLPIPNESLDTYYAVENELETLKCGFRQNIYSTRNRIKEELNKEFGGAAASSSSAEEKVAYIRACPADDCRGFLSTGWKCGMCGIHACSKCHEIKAKEHECKQENVETAQLLAKEAKLCPKCAAPICKVSGCDQIWCTQCHTAFNWKTRKIVSGVIHNPHYYEWMRQNGDGQRREIRDIPCGGLPDSYTVIRHVDKLIGSLVPMDMRECVDAIHRITGEMIDLRTWYRNRNLQDTMDIRVKYLTKEYDDVKFKKMLQMRAKAHEKIQNIDQILDMFIMVISTIFQGVLAMELNVAEPFDLKAFGKELYGICDYFNDSMKKLSTVYQCKTPKIDKYKRLIRVGDRRQ